MSKKTRNPWGGDGFSKGQSTLAPLSAKALVTPRVDPTSSSSKLKPNAGQTKLNTHFKAPIAASASSSSPYGRRAPPRPAASLHGKENAFRGSAASSDGPPTEKSIIDPKPRGVGHQILAGRSTPAFASASHKIISAPSRGPRAGWTDSQDASDVSEMQRRKQNRIQRGFGKELDFVPSKDHEGFGERPPPRKKQRTTAPLKLATGPQEEERKVLVVDSSPPAPVLDSRERALPCGSEGDEDQTPYSLRVFSQSQARTLVPDSDDDDDGESSSLDEVIARLLSNGIYRGADDSGFAESLHSRSSSHPPIVLAYATQEVTLLAREASDATRQTEDEVLVEETISPSSFATRSSAQELVEDRDEVEERDLEEVMDSQAPCDASIYFPEEEVEEAASAALMPSPQAPRLPSPVIAEPVSVASGPSLPSRIPVEDPFDPPTQDPSSLPPSHPIVVVAPDAVSPTLSPPVLPPKRVDTSFASRINPAWEGQTITKSAPRQASVMEFFAPIPRDVDTDDDDDDDAVVQETQLPAELELAAAVWEIQTRAQKQRAGLEVVPEQEEGGEDEIVDPEVEEAIVETSDHEDDAYPGIPLVSPVPGPCKPLDTEYLMAIDIDNLSRPQEETQWESYWTDASLPPMPPTQESYPPVWIPTELPEQYRSSTPVALPEDVTESMIDRSREHVARWEARDAAKRAADRM